MNIDYCEGRISAFKEAMQLLCMLHSTDTVINTQLEILLEHLGKQALREEHFIEDTLDAMELEGG